MKHLCLILLAAALFSPQIASAAPPQLERWELHRDLSTDGRVDGGDSFGMSLTFRGGAVWGYYTGDNDSTFQGHVHTVRGAKVLVLEQTDDNYRNIWLGREVAPGHFVGTWTDGKSHGDFELRRK